MTFILHYTEQLISITQSCSTSESLHPSIPLCDYHLLSYHFLPLHPIASVLCLHPDLQSLHFLPASILLLLSPVFGWSVQSPIISTLHSAHPLAYLIYKQPSWNWSFPVCFSHSSAQVAELCWRKPHSPADCCHCRGMIFDLRPGLSLACLSYLFSAHFLSLLFLDCSKPLLVTSNPSPILP